MPAAGSKGAPKNQGEMKDDTNSSREEKQDCGQPGFTVAERKHFGTIMKEYRGKRMRIDYFVASEEFKDKIVSCKMHGQGVELQGFYGSDHCPVSVELLGSNLSSSSPQL